jgi:ABC-type enterochelin transport system permease subunit
MRMQIPRTIALLTAALALFVAGLLLAAYAAGWPRSIEPVLLTPA